MRQSVKVSVNRKLKGGKYGLSEVFIGIEKDPNFRALFNDGDRKEVLEKTRLDVVPEDSYMYIDDEAGNVCAGLNYLRHGEERVLYLDILHELTHIRQWRAGQPLWDRRYSYVDRPTEIEAYEVAVKVARKLGMRDREISDYLRVEWTSREEHERLCRRLGVRLTDSRAH